MRSRAGSRRLWPARFLLADHGGPACLTLISVSLTSLHCVPPPGTRNSREAEAGLVSADGYRSPTLAPLARDMARSLTEAGLTLHHCAAHDPLYRLGGVCLLPVPAEAGTAPGGISVSWTTHDLLLRDRRQVPHLPGTQQAMNAALGGVLTAFGYQVAPFGCGGAWLVTGRRRRERRPGSDRTRHSPGDTGPATSLPR